MQVFLRKWWVVSFTNRPLYHKESYSGVPLVRNLVGPRADVDDNDILKSLLLTRLELDILGRPPRLPPIDNSRVQLKTLEWLESESAEFLFSELMLTYNLVEQF
jgi:hypothetical protein